MRILLVKTTSMGDVIHNLPVVSDVRRHFPDAHIDWLVEDSFAALPQLHAGVRRVIPSALRRWRRRPWSATAWREFFDMRSQLRHQQYDKIIDAQGLLKSALLGALARGEKCGYSAATARERAAAWFYDRRFEVDASLHAVERNRRLAAAALGYAYKELPLDYGLASMAGAAAVDDDYAVLLTASSRPGKEWPGPDWLALAASLNAIGLGCVLPAGDAAARRRAHELAQHCGRACVAPPQSLTQLASLLAGARLVVGVDTGLTHLAAALGRPTLALYCDSDAALTGVCAASPTINLGRRGAPPTAAEAVAAALQLVG